MRGADGTSGSLFSHVDLEARVRTRHPLRKIRQVVKRAIVRHWSEDNGEALASLDTEFEALYTDFGRPSIAPERLIRGQPAPDPVLGPLRTAADGADAIFRWFVGLGIDDAVWACNEGKPFRLGDCFSGLLGPGRGWPRPGDRGATAAAFIRD